MGTMISLALGRLEVDWGKNNFFSDHGALFQDSDIKPVASYYANEDWPDGDPIVEMNEG
jgi:HEPN superfamily Toprim-like protein